MNESGVRVFTLPLRGRVGKLGSALARLSERGGVNSVIKRTISDFKRQSARRLRFDNTHAEAILWRHLRQLDVKGSHFRRQAVIGPYIADFACLAARLIIEVDGSQHGTNGGKLRDDARTRWLNAEGYRVLRFWNNDVISKPRSVMEAIHRALDVTPPRLPSANDPPPQGEGGFLRSE